MTDARSPSPALDLTVLLTLATALIYAAGWAYAYHWYSDFNLGQYFTFWDRLVGTYRSPKTDYEDVPAGIIYRPKNVVPTSTAPTALGGRSANPA